MSATNAGPKGNTADYLAEANRAGEECRQAAITYCGLGWSALCNCPPDHVGVGKRHGKECEHPGKVPLGPWKEYMDRLASEQELNEKWRRNPNANVGIALGPVSGLIGVDVDGPEGEEELLRASAGDLPPTLEFTSGKGRRLLYALPKGVKLRTTHHDSKKKRPLSLLAYGSQTVMPPSRHPHGRRYAWKPGYGLGEIAAASAPKWLLEALREDGRRKGKRAAPLAEGEVIADGYRDITLTSLAGTMRRRGMSEGSIVAALRVENEERCDPPLPDSQVEKIARSVAGYAPAGGSAAGGRPSTNGDGSQQTGQANDRGPSTSQAGPAGSAPPSEYPLGNLVVRAGRPRATPYKIVVPVEGVQGGARVYASQVTTTDSSRRQPARALARLAGVTIDEADDVLVRLVADAVSCLEAKQQCSGPTFHSIIAERVPTDLQLTHRTTRGLWSETHGREITRADLIAHIPSPLLDACAQAADAPQEGRHALIRTVQEELAVLHADLLQSLPPEEDVDLGATTRAGIRFRGAMVAIWTRPRLLERQRTSDGADVGTSASLVSRIRQAAADYRAGKTQIEARERWREIHTAYAAWWRPYVAAGGEHSIALAMRYELAGQIGVELPECHDQASFGRIGQRYRCLVPEIPTAGKPLPDMLSGGEHRLALLAPALVAELLCQPEEPVEEDNCDVP